MCVESKKQEIKREMACWFVCYWCDDCNGVEVRFLLWKALLQKWQEKEKRFTHIPRISPSEKETKRLNGVHPSPTPFLALLPPIPHTMPSSASTTPLTTHLFLCWLWGLLNHSTASCCNTLHERGCRLPDATAIHPLKGVVCVQQSPRILCLENMDLSHQCQGGQPLTDDFATVSTIKVK